MAVSINGKKKGQNEKATKKKSRGPRFINIGLLKIAWALSIYFLFYFWLLLFINTLTLFQINSYIFFPIYNGYVSRVHRLN